MTPLILFGVAVIISVLIYPAAIGQLARARMGQQIREEGPAAHQGKAGTPTAGGLVFLLVGLVLYLIADRSLAGGFVLIALFLGGALGFIDDYSAIRGGRNLGLQARYKIVIQLATGAALGWLALRWDLTTQLVPFDGRHAIGAWMILVGALAVAAGSNAFNLTDGSDGLAAGTGAITFGALAMIAVLQHQMYPWLKPLGAIADPHIREHLGGRDASADRNDPEHGAIVVGDDELFACLLDLPEVQTSAQEHRHSAACRDAQLPPRDHSPQHRLPERSDQPGHRVQSEQRVH